MITTVPDFPTPKLEVAWDAKVSDPLDAVTGGWDDLSPYLRSGNTGYGRARRLDRMNPGTASLALNDFDNIFDPANPDSSTADRMRPRARVRLSWEFDGVTYPDFCGFLRTVKHSRPNLDDHLVTLDCVDASTVLNQIPLPPSAWALEIFRDKPLHWWKLGAGTTDVSDSGSRPITVTAHNVAAGSPLTVGAKPGILGQDIIVGDPGAGGTFDGANSYVDCGPYTSLPATPPWAIEVPFSVAKADIGVYQRTIFSQGLVGVLIRVHGTGSSPGFPGNAGHAAIGVVDTATATFTDLVGAPDVADGRLHLLRATYDGTTLVLYIDGAYAGALAIGGINPYGAVSIGSYGPSSPPMFPFMGEIGDVSIYDSVDAIQPARAIEHYVAWRLGWSGDFPGERINRILDFAGVSATDRNITPGLCRLGPAALAPFALGHIADVADSDSGAFSTDGAGRYTYLGRDYLILPGRSTVSQATFTDVPGGGVAYDLPLDLTIDDQYLWNQAKCSRAGGAVQTVDDLVAQDRDGVIPVERTGLLFQTDDEALSMCHRQLMRGALGDINTITVNPLRDPETLFPLVLRLQMLDRLTFNHRAESTISTRQLLVQGKTNTFGPGSWITTLPVSPADTHTYARFGTTVLNTAVLA